VRRTTVRGNYQRTRVSNQNVPEENMAGEGFLGGLGRIRTRGSEEENRGGNEKKSECPTKVKTVSQISRERE